MRIGFWVPWDLGAFSGLWRHELQPSANSGVLMSKFFDDVLRNSNYLRLINSLNYLTISFHEDEQTAKLSG